MMTWVDGWKKYVYHKTDKEILMSMNKNKTNIQTKHISNSLTVCLFLNLNTIKKYIMLHTTTIHKFNIYY